MTRSFIPTPVRSLLAGVCITLSLLLSGWASPVVGQTRFQENTNPVDLARYTTVEQCLAIAHRLGSTALGQETTNWDTMPPGMTAWRNPWSQNVIDTARQCSARWAVETAPLENFRWLFELYLMGGRKQDAHALLVRRLALVPAGHESAWAAVVDTAMGFYASARPFHLREVDSLLEVLSRLSVEAWSKEKRIERYWDLRARAEEIGDDPLAMRAATKAESLFVSLDDKERQSPWYHSRRPNTALKAKWNSFFVHYTERMDSLRRGTQAFVQLVLTQERTIFKGIDPQGNFETGFGKKSPQIAGDFWFPEKSKVLRPSQGKISFIKPFDNCWKPGRMSNNIYSICMRDYAMLRRLGAQFPAVEMTILTYQVGRAVLQTPPSSAEEAEDQRRWYLEEQKLAAVLVMDRSDFFRVDDPDKRMVNTLWTLKNMNAFGCRNYNGRLGCDGAILVDQDGIILGTFGASKESEKKIAGMVEILIQRSR